MKKISVFLVMVMISCFVLCACGSGSNKAEDTNSNTEENNNTADDNTPAAADGTNAVADNTNVVADNTNVVADNTSDTSNATEDDSKETVKIEKDQTVTMKRGTDEIEFTLTSVAFENEVHSRSDNQFSQYFPDQEDESYIVFKANIKNIGGDAIGQGFFDKIEATFDNKYNYTLQQVDPESTVLSQFWSIAPLKTYEIFFVQSVPDEVKNLGCNGSFTVGDTIYKY